jgi:hypothetical protein
MYTSLSFYLLLLYIYSHVHTLFGSFLPPAPLPQPLPPFPVSSRQVLLYLYICLLEDILVASMILMLMNKSAINTHAQVFVAVVFVDIYISHSFG